ncbi:MAG TPA: hypothetical protein VN176_11285 [Verrucomicrobiae bacterium]|jgi:hypothetical protein|nr:hypothetical protein [Verrucomicrobiae bacterium]
MAVMPQGFAIKLTRAVARSRLGTALFSGAKTFIVSLLRTLYVLWLQVTGVLFAAFTVIGGAGLFRQYRAGTLATDRTRFALTLLFIAVCGWFTLVSFVRASRTGRNAGKRK